MEKINIFVISHKSLDTSKYPGRKIIYVGKQHNCKADNITTFTDNTGNNISKLNPYYCELTALYWVWKNYPKSEYIGFEHYSRNFFKTLFKIASLGSLYNKAKKFDILHIPKSNHIKSEKNFWCSREGKFLYPILEKSIKKMAPDYYSDWLKIMNQTHISYCNMFICKWKTFDQYMKLIFRILDDAYKNIKTLAYENQSRSIGFMAERLLDAFILHNNYKEKSCFIRTKKH